MYKLTKDKKIDSSVRKNITKNSFKIVGLLIVAMLGIVAFNDKGVIASESINVNDNELLKRHSNSTDENEDRNSKNRENIDTATNKQNLIYTSYENDLYADNAKDIEKMLNKWNYLREDGKKIAYLTFDDGPSTEVTQQILETLKANNIKATFFILGSNVEGQKQSLQRVMFSAQQ